MIDPAPAGLTRVLALADQLVLVAPASPEAATALANTQQWLTAHGYDELAARAVTVINGVSSRQQPGRAPGRVGGPGPLPGHRPGAVGRPAVAASRTRPAALHPQTRLAYTALAGVLVAGLAPGAEPGTRSPHTHVRGKESW